MKYLIGIDLDGTLLNSSEVITEYTQNTLRSINNDGHKVIISTGRSYLGAINYHNQLGLGLPLITLNGSLISLPDGTHIKKTLPNNLVVEMFNTLKPLIITALFNCVDTMYSYNHNEELEKLFNGATSSNVYEFDVNNINYDILNGVVLINAKDKEAFESYFNDKIIKSRFWGVYNGVCFFDVYLEGISKASALKEVLDYYQMDTNKLITFGDGPNDLEMIKLAKYGFAMKNGADKVKEISYQVTTYTNNEDGVAKQLLKVIK